MIVQPRSTTFFLPWIKAYWSWQAGYASSLKPTRLAALPTLLALAVNFCRRQFHCLRTSQHIKLLWCARIQTSSKLVLSFLSTGFLSKALMYLVILAARARLWKNFICFRNELEALIKSWEWRHKTTSSAPTLSSLPTGWAPSMFCNAAMLRCVASSFSCSLTLTMQVNNLLRLWMICTLLTTKCMPDASILHTVCDRICTYTVISCYIHIA